MSEDRNIRIIVAGGRDFNDYEYVQKKLKELVLDKYGKDVEIVHGNSKGCDQLAERFARENDLPATRFDAEWDHFGPSAGPRRNKEMSHYGDHLIAFPGGRGTHNMRSCMYIGNFTDLEWDYKGS